MLEDAHLSAGFVYMEKSIVLFTKNMGSDFCAFFIFWSGGGKAGGVACFSRGGEAVFVVKVTKDRDEIKRGKAHTFALY